MKEDHILQCTRIGTVPNETIPVGQPPINTIYLLVIPLLLFKGIGINGDHEKEPRIFSPTKIFPDSIPACAESSPL